MKFEIRGLRKFIIALLSLLFGFVGLMNGDISDVIYFQLNTAILLLYGASNAANQFTHSKVSTKETSKKEST
jgi:hypothetical protein